YVNNRTAHQFNLHSTIEMLPNPKNRVTLPKNPRASDYFPDNIGLPRPVVNFRLDDYTLEGCRKAWSWHLKVFDAIGVRT
ncbi:hypothetical protein ABMA58_17670, partial [Oceanospirillum sp. HFRX-1_2]